MNLVQTLLNRVKSNFNYVGEGTIENPFTQQILVANEASIDAANRLRVSQQITLGDYQQTNDKLPYFFDEFILGSTITTYQPLVGGVPMIVSGTNSLVIRQTYQRHNYAAGKSHLVEITFSSFHSETDITKRAGYYTAPSLDHTDADGFYIESNENGHYLVIAKNGTEKLRIEQADWDDPLDGTGASRVNMNWINFNVFVIDFLYLGGTQVRFGFILNGQVQWVYKFSHANNFVDTITLHPSLPIRYEIRSGSTGTSGQFTHICAQVSSEGAVGEVGRVRAFNTGTTHLDANVSGTKYALLGVRLKSGYENISINPVAYTAFALTNDNFLVEILINPTVTGTFTYTDGGDGAVDVAIGTTANTVTGGDLVSTQYGNQDSAVNEEENSARRIGASILGVPDELVLCVTPLSPNLDVHGTLKIRELI